MLHSVALLVRSVVYLPHLLVSLTSRAVSVAELPNYYDEKEGEN